MRPILRGLSVGFLLLAIAFPALAQKKPGGGGGSTPPPAANPAIAYRNLSGDAFIHVANADGSNNVTVLHRGYTPSWGPSGAGTEGDPHRFVCTDWTETQLLTYRVKVEGSVTRSEVDLVLRHEAEGDWVATPAWSGTRIAYMFRSDWRTGLNPATVQLIDANGGMPEQIYEAAPGMSITRLAWFRDGLRLAISEQERGNEGNSRIVVLKVLNTSTDPVEVSEALPAGIVGPLGGVSMATTNDVIAFHARISANLNDWKNYIYTLDLGTPGAQPVRRILGTHPTWSPDDTQILFRDSRDTLSTLTLSTGRTAAIAPMGITPDWRH